MAANIWSAFLLTLPWAASTGWAWFIFWISSDPSPAGAGIAGEGGFLSFLPRADLFAHFGVYAIFAFFLRWSVGGVHIWFPLEYSIKNAWPVIVAGVYGGSMELVQNATDGRAGEVLDATANVAGALTTIIVVGYAWPRLRRLGRASAG